MIHPYIYVGLNKQPQKPASLMGILEACAGILNFTADEVLKGGRKGNLPMVRHLYAYISRRTTSYSLEYIGSVIGRDHASILHSVKTINNFLDINDCFVLELLDKLDYLYD